MKIIYTERNPKRNKDVSHQNGFETELYIYKSNSTKIYRIQRFFVTQLKCLSKSSRKWTDVFHFQNVSVKWNKKIFPKNFSYSPKKIIPSKISYISQKTIFLYFVIDADLRSLSNELSKPKHEIKNYTPIIFFYEKKLFFILVTHVT